MSIRDQWLCEVKDCLKDTWKTCKDYKEGKCPPKEKDKTPDVRAEKVYLNEEKSWWELNLYTVSGAIKTFDKNDFDSGILPLNQIIDKIWDDLFKLLETDFSKEQWSSFREKLDNGLLNCWDEFVYSIKIKDDYDQGPYALLIGETFVLQREMVGEDYFDIPEIIRDICRCFDEIHEYNLLEKYIINTKKYMIKFKSNQHDISDLGYAIKYKHDLIKGVLENPYVDNSFSGNGRPILPTDIIKIREIPDDPMLLTIIKN